MNKFKNPIMKIKGNHIDYKTDTLAFNSNSKIEILQLGKLKIRLNDIMPALIRKNIVKTKEGYKIIYKGLLDYEDQILTFDSANEVYEYLNILEKQLAKQLTNGKL